MFQSLAFRFGAGILGLTVGLPSPSIRACFQPPMLNEVLAKSDRNAGKTIRMRAILDLNDVYADKSRPNEHGYNVLSLPFCPKDECEASVDFDRDVRELDLQPYHYFWV